MSKMNFAIALKMSTDQFKRGANVVKKGLMSIQYQVLGMASALGLGGIGLKNLVSRFVEVARETTKARVALKNISIDAATFSNNMKFLTKLSGKYGQEINGMTSEFSKFSAAASSAGISLADQHEIFSSFTRSITAFGMSSEDAKLSYMALSQMMSKGRVSSEELRRQLGERMPIAMEAMARATGGTIQQLDDLLKKGAILSKDVMLPFVKEMEKMTPSIDVDNIETSLNRLSNIFTQLTEKINIAGLYKKIIDGAGEMLLSLEKSFARVITTIATSLVGSKLIGAFRKLTDETKIQNQAILNDKIQTEQQLEIATAKRVEAERRYNDTLVLYNRASDDEKLRSYNKLQSRKSALDKARLREKAGLLARDAAAEKAAALQTQTIWTAAFTKIGTFVKGILMSIKSLFSTLIPMALIGIATNLVMKMVEIRKEAQRIKNITKDNQNSIFSAGNTSEIQKIQTLHKIIKDRFGTEQQIQAAQGELLNLLGIEQGKQVDINKKVAERIKLLKEAARAEVAAQNNAQLEQTNRDIVNKVTKDGDAIAFGQFYKKYERVQGNMGKDLSSGAIYSIAKEFGLDTGNRTKSGEFANLIRGYSQNTKAIEYNNQILENAVRSGIGITEAPTINETPTGTTKTDLTDLQKVEEKYKEELLKISNLHASGVTTQEDKNKAIDELNKTIYREIGALEGANSNLNETFLKAKQGVENPLYKEAVKTVTLPTEGLRDTTFDYKKDSLQQLDELRSIKAEYINALKNISEEEFAGITDLIDQEAGNLKNIDDLITAGTLKKDITDLSKEIKGNLYNGIEDVYNIAKNLGNAFLSIKDVFSDSEATFFEKLITVFDALFSTINGIMSVMNTIEKISTLTDSLSKAKQVASATEIGTIAAITGAKVSADATETTSAIAKSAAVVTALSAEEVAATGVMAAKSAAAYASIPFVGVGLAAGQIATMQALISGAKALSGLPGFKDGGIVPGSSFSGDNVLARVNSGELILNRSQQANLYKMAQGGFTAPLSTQQNLKFEIEGTKLVAILNQISKKKQRV